MTSAQDTLWAAAAAACERLAAGLAPGGQPNYYDDADHLSDALEALAREPAPRPTAEFVRQGRCQAICASSRCENMLLDVRCTAIETPAPLCMQACHRRCRRRRLAGRRPADSCAHQRNGASSVSDALAAGFTWDLTSTVCSCARPRGIPCHVAHTPTHPPALAGN